MSAKELHNNHSLPSLSNGKMSGFLDDSNVCPTAWMQTNSTNLLWSNYTISLHTCKQFWFHGCAEATTWSKYEHGDWHIRQTGFFYKPHILPHRIYIKMWENKGCIQNLGNSNSITNLKHRAKQNDPTFKSSATCLETAPCLEIQFSRMQVVLFTKQISQVSLYKMVKIRISNPHTLLIESSFQKYL